MSYLSKKMQTVSRSETVRLDTLGCDAEILKITLKDAEQIDKMKEHDPVQGTLYILSHFVLVDGEPIADENDLETVGEMTAEIVNEIAAKFAAVNGRDIEDLKKKAGI